MFLIVPNGPLRALASTLSSLSSREGHQYRYCGDIHERRRTARTKLAAQHCCNVAKTNDLCCTYNMISPVSHAPRIGSQFRWHAPRVYRVGEKRSRKNGVQHAYTKGYSDDSGAEHVYPVHTFTVQIHVYVLYTHAAVHIDSVSCGHLCTRG